MAATTLGLNKKQQLNGLKLITHIGALFPALWLYYDWYNYNMTDEIGESLLRTGKPAIILLVLSLAITPVAYLTGYRIITPLRKLLGLYAFWYVVGHLAIFAVIDYGLDLAIVWDEIVNRQYTLYGFISFLIMVPLAATSTNFMMRKVGGKRWKALHRWVYLAGILGIVHYILVWWPKRNLNQPILWAVLLAIFLIMRIPAVKTQILQWRKQLVG